jgi:hypothetical protein
MKRLVKSSACRHSTSRPHGLTYAGRKWKRTSEVHLKLCTDAIACSALLQGRCGCSGFFLRGASLWEWKPRCQQRRLVVSSLLHARLEEAWLYGGCGQMSTTDASLHVLVCVQHVKEPIPGLYISTQQLDAPGDIKAIHCPPQRACSTQAAAPSASNISTSLSKQLFRIITLGWHSRAPTTPRPSTPLPLPLPLLIHSVSIRRRLCVRFEEVGSCSRRLHSAWRLPRSRARVPVVCLHLPHLHHHHHQNISRGCSFPISSAQTPRPSTESLACPHTSAVFAPHLFSSRLFSALFLHHFFLTNTHQWPHSL